MKKPKNELTKEINHLIDSIEPYLNKELPHYIDENTGNIVPSMGARGLWNYEIKKSIIERFNDYKPTILHVDNSEQVELIKILIKLKQEIEDLFYGVSNKEFDYSQIDERLNKIRDITHSLPHKDDFIYSYSAANNSKIVEDIHNLLTIQLPSYSSEKVKNFVNRNNPPYFPYELGLLIITLYNAFKNSENSEILLTNTKIDIFIEQNINVKNVINYVNDAENILRDTQSIAEQVKQNFSIQASCPLLTSYDSELITLKKSIGCINKFIICIFILIIILFIFKFLLIFIDFSFFDIKFIQFTNLNNAYTFITFSALILSFSALLTYFIKDRKRLINTHDHLLLKKLELNSLPTYMSELTQEQRRNLYISLAPHYFNGISKNNEKSSTESDH